MLHRKDSTSLILTGRSHELRGEFLDAIDRSLKFTAIAGAGIEELIDAYLAHILCLDNWVNEAWGDFISIITQNWGNGITNVLTNNQILDMRRTVCILFLG